jgi:hypothetical protein
MAHEVGWIIVKGYAKSVAFYYLMLVTSCLQYSLIIFLVASKLDIISSSEPVVLAGSGKF